MQEVVPFYGKICAKGNMLEGNMVDWQLVPFIVDFGQKGNKV